MKLYPKEIVYRVVEHILVAHDKSPMAGYCENSNYTSGSVFVKEGEFLC